MKKILLLIALSVSILASTSTSYILGEDVNGEEIPINILKSTEDSSTKITIENGVISMRTEYVSSQSDFVKMWDGEHVVEVRVHALTDYVIDDTMMIYKSNDDLIIQVFDNTELYDVITDSKKYHNSEVKFYVDGNLAFSIQNQAGDHE